MAQPLILESDMTNRRVEQHLEPAEVAAYVDGTLADDMRSDLEAHLVTCTDCRGEVVEVSRIARALPGRAMHRHVWIPTAAAAAAVILLIAWPRTIREPEQLAHREAPVTATVSPRALVPIGVVDSATTITWSSVPHADRYHVGVYDASGSVIWERETSDTTANLPDSVGLSPRRSYHWQVVANVGFDRRVASELVEFSVRRTRGR